MPIDDRDPPYLVERARDLMAVIVTAPHVPTHSVSCFVFAFDVFCASCAITVPAHTPHRCERATARAAPP